MTQYLRSVLSSSFRFAKELAKNLGLLFAWFIAWLCSSLPICSCKLSWSNWFESWSWFGRLFVSKNGKIGFSIGLLLRRVLDGAIVEIVQGKTLVRVKKSFACLLLGEHYVIWRPEVELEVATSKAIWTRIISRPVFWSKLSSRFVGERSRGNWRLRKKLKVVRKYVDRKFARLRCSAAAEV